MSHSEWYTELVKKQLRKMKWKENCNYCRYTKKLMDEMPCIRCKNYDHFHKDLEFFEEENNHGKNRLS